MSNEEKAEHAHGLRDVIPFLRDADQLFEHLEQQAALVQEGATLFARPEKDQTSTFERIEQEANRLSNEIEQYLQHAYALKIDRDVLYEISSHLNTVLTPIIRSARTERSAAGPRPGTTETVAIAWTTTLAKRIADEVGQMVKAVSRLRENDHVLIAQIARELREHSRETNRAYDDALAALLDANGGNSADGATLTREAFALEDVKHIIKRCGEMAEYLALVAVKLS